MSCSNGIELGRSFIQPRYWGRRGLDYLWSGIGAYLARSSALSLSVWSGVDFWRIAARRPRSAGGILPAVVPGDASAGGVASPLSGVAARRAGAQFGGEDYNDDLARLKSPARQSRLRAIPAV